MAIHVLNASGSLTPYAARLEAYVAGRVDAAAAELGIDPGTIDVVVRPGAAYVVPEIGVGGYCPDGHTVFVSLDPAHPELEQAIERRLPATVAHELHHVARRRGPGFGRTLLAVLVSEGLACHFAVATTGERGPWIDALSPEQLATLGARAEAGYGAAYDHRLWFFGSSPDDVPRWAGYALGFELVGRYLAAHPDETAASLATAPAELFA